MTSLKRNAMERLQTILTTTARAELREEFGQKNHFALPRLRKVIINCGLGQLRGNQKQIEALVHGLALITGQKPVLKRARKSVSSFKIREGEPIALSLTLRGQRMYDFLERLIRIALPRVRDFRGISRNQLDGRGNVTIGIREFAVFPEIRPEEFELAHGLEATIVTTAQTNREGEALLKRCGIPFVH